MIPALMMEAAWLSDISTLFYQTAWCDIPEGSSLQMSVVSSVCESGLL